MLPKKSCKASLTFSANFESTTFLKLLIDAWLFSTSSSLCAVFEQKKCNLQTQPGKALACIPSDYNFHSFIRGFPTKKSSLNIALQCSWCQIIFLFMFGRVSGQKKVDRKLASHEQGKQNQNQNLSPLTSRILFFFSSVCWKWNDSFRHFSRWTWMVKLTIMFFYRLLFCHRIKKTPKLQLIHEIPLNALQLLCSRDESLFTANCTFSFRKRSCRDSYTSQRATSWIFACNNERMSGDLSSRIFILRFSSSSGFFWLANIYYAHPSVFWSKWWLIGRSMALVVSSVHCELFSSTLSSL